MSEEVKQQLKDLLKNIDFETGIYTVRDFKFQIRDLTISDMEELQDKEAEKVDIENAGELTAKETLAKAREWQNFILDIAFGSAETTKTIKKNLTALEFQYLIEGVFVFLGRFTGPKGAKEFMNTSKEKAI